MIKKQFQCKNVSFWDSFFLITGKLRAAEIMYYAVVILLEVIVGNLSDNYKLNKFLEPALSM